MIKSSKNIVQTKSFEFALMVIELYKRLQAQGERILSKQLLRCVTSIGANVEEADAGQSKKDFLTKMAIASKEARETRYWLKLLRESKLTDIDVTNELERIEELIRILTAIVKTTSNQ